MQAPESRCSRGSRAKRNSIENWKVLLRRDMRQLLEIGNEARRSWKNVFGVGAHRRTTAGEKAGAWVSKG